MLMHVEESLISDDSSEDEGDFKGDGDDEQDEDDKEVVFKK